MDSETFWCLVGDRVQCWFLYENNLTKEQFKTIKKKVLESKS